MEKEMKVDNIIQIGASRDKVWAALTEPEWTKKYMFNCAVDSDWRVGSPVVWKMQHEGKEIIPVKGHVEEIVPGRLLKYSVSIPS